MVRNLFISLTIMLFSFSTALAKENPQMENTKTPTTIAENTKEVNPKTEKTLVDSKGIHSRYTRKPQTITKARRTLAQRLRQVRMRNCLGGIIF